MKHENVVLFIVATALVCLLQPMILYGFAKATKQSAFHFTEHPSEIPLWGYFLLWSGMVTISLICVFTPKMKNEEAIVSDES